MRPSYITGTHIAYLHLCHRKLWLFAHGIQMEQRSQLVAEGKFIGEHAYAQRAQRWREIQVEGIKLDHYDPQQGIVREVKKSAHREAAHVAQLKYYLFVLRRNLIHVSHGLLEYPRLRQTEEVWLSAEDMEQIPTWEQQVWTLLAEEACPPLQKKSLCRRCAYREFCYAE